MSEIKGFFGDYRFLSNFWSVRVALDGIVFPSTEHAYQAAKTLDVELRKRMSRAVSAAEVKKMGTSLQLRPDWEEVKEAVMRDLLIQKFSNEPFTSQLLATGDAYLEETNHWNDTYWGVCRGNGKNRLGTMLMEIRSDLRQILGDSTHGA